MTIAPSLKSFLALIGWSEGADYNTIVTGVDGPATFSDFSDHPFAPQFHRPPVVWRLPAIPANESTAAGRYQILYHWWFAYKTELHLPDFSPSSQDAVAIQQIKERHALEMIADLDIQAAITACSNIWASFPNNNYGQGGKTMPELLDKFGELNSQ